MTHRCEHCHTEYVYQTSGEGINNVFNNEHYCPDCMQKIIQALKKVPVKFIQKYNEIEITKDILDKINLLKNPINKNKEEHNNLLLPFSLVRFVNLNYQHIEIYTIDFVEYVLCWNNDNDNDKHLYRLDEYNIINKCFTGKPWKVKTKSGFCLGGNLCRTFNSENIAVKPMETPKADMSYMNLKYN